jgi:hypothetical protein
MSIELLLFLYIQTPRKILFLYWSWSRRCERQLVGQSVLVSVSLLELMSKPFFLFFCFLAWHLQASWCGSPSLKRAGVRNLLIHLLLGLVRAVTLEWKSRRTYNRILRSHLRLRQPGGPGDRIYIPQEQGAPVILQGTEIPFRCLLRLAGLQWRYSNPPSHGTVPLFFVTIDFVLLFAS